MQWPDSEDYSIRYSAFSLSSLLSSSSSQGEYTEVSIPLSYDDAGEYYYNTSLYKLKVTGFTGD